MDGAVGLLAAQHGELAGLLDGVDEGDWAAPSPCPGWSAADVVLHLAQTDEMALASLEGRLGGYLADQAELLAGGGVADVDEGAARMVEAERGLAPEALRDRWEGGAARLRDALAAADPSARVDWVAGQLAARTLATTRLAEAWIHSGDVAESLGAARSATERLQPIARLAWRTLPYAFARAGRELHGPVELVLDAPGGGTWRFGGEEPAATTVTGPALDLCLVAARRRAPEETGVRATGPDAAAVLELVRTYA
jgi:uncharacterized protein (TIGR03084 family)